MWPAASWPAVQGAGTGLPSLRVRARARGPLPGALVTSFRVVGRCGGQVCPVSGSGLSTAWARRGLVAGGRNRCECRQAGRSTGQAGGTGHGGLARGRRRARMAVALALQVARAGRAEAVGWPAEAHQGAAPPAAPRQGLLVGDQVAGADTHLAPGRWAGLGLRSFVWSGGPPGFGGDDAAAAVVADDPVSLIPPVALAAAVVLVSEAEVARDGSPVAGRKPGRWLVASTARAMEGPRLGLYGDRAPVDAGMRPGQVPAAPFAVLWVPDPAAAADRVVGLIAVQRPLAGVVVAEGMPHADRVGVVGAGLPGRDVQRAEQ
jgi:hypothetical protein